MRWLTLAYLTLICSCRLWFDEMSPEDENDSSLPPVGEWRAIAIGQGIAAAIDSDSALWSWGNRKPVHRLTETTDWTQVTAGDDHSCGLRTEGELWCWGSNFFGQLGIGTTSESEQSDPVRVGNALWKEVRAGSAATCAIQADTTLWCWGTSLLVGSDQVAPVRIGDQAGWHHLEMSATSACALDSGGQAWCWGDNSFNYLGIAGAMPGVPKLSSHAVGWQSLAVGLRHFCGIDCGWHRAQRVRSAGRRRGRLLGLHHERRGRPGSGIQCDADPGGRLGSGHRFGTWVRACLRNERSRTDDLLGKSASVRGTSGTLSIPGSWRSYAGGSFNGCALANDDQQPGAPLFCWGDGSTGVYANGSAWSATPKYVTRPR